MTEMDGSFRPFFVGSMSAWWMLLLLASCKQGKPSVEPGVTAEVRSYVFKHEGIVRSVGIFDPRRERLADPRPAVVVLHGGLGGDDDTVALSFGKLNQLAAEDDFLVVYPAGVGGHWNDGRRVQQYVAQRERVNDTGFLAKLVDELVEKRSVAPEAIFFVGVSDGAMMTHRFACERTERLRAFVAVIGSMPYAVARRRSRCGTKPISALMINGTEDPIVPWEGGFVRYGEQELGRVLPVERTFEFWRRHNGCAAVETRMIPDFAPDDGSRIERRKSIGCRDGTKVELFVVRGAGHTWPSGWQYLPESLVGPTSRDIDASIAAWRFFQSTL